jgi:hypothetical protein
MSIINKEQKRIGLFVKKTDSNFTNGCVQQAVFIKELFTNLGFVCEYVTIQPDFRIFPDIQDPIKLINKHTNIKHFSLFLFISLHLNTIEETQIEVWKSIKSNDIKCVNLICGNLFVLHQEEFVFGHHDIMKNQIGVENMYDEYWVLEMYPFLVDYIKLYTGSPVHLVPYVWNNTVLKMYMKKNNIDLDLDYHKVNRNKLNIVIFEPNMSIHKSSLVPLLIAENYYKKYDKILNKVYVFSGKKILTETHNQHFVSSLSIFKNNKLEAYDRVIMPEAFKIIRENNNYINVVVSHNILNNLNFLHLELLSLNIPIIHNCEPFKENNLFYTDTNMSDAIGLLETVRNDFFITETYRNNSNKIIAKYHPHAFDRTELYKAHTQRLSKIFVNKDDENRDTLGNVYTLVETFIKVSDFVSKKTRIENSLFYNDTGIVILILDRTELILLKATLNNFVTFFNELRVEIVFNKMKIEENIIAEVVASIQKPDFVIDLLPISDDNESFESNEYMACVYSNFEKCMFVSPGVVLETTPQSLIDTFLLPVNNSVSFFQSFARFNTLSDLDQKIHNVMTQTLNLDEVSTPMNEDALINSSKILFLNKNDVTCMKVLGTMCELYKVNKHLVNNVNMLDIVCRLNFINDRSRLKNEIVVYGDYIESFKGYGLAILLDETFKIAVINKLVDYKIAKKPVMVNISKYKTKMTLSSEGYIVFSGTAPAQKTNISITEMLAKNFHSNHI